MNNPLIFLSHPGEDTPFARELAQLLRPAGVDVWLDVERLEPGDRWEHKIEDGLRQATAMVLYVGKSGVRIGSIRKCASPSIEVRRIWISS